MTIKYKSIGTIHTPFEKPEGMPIQPRGAKGIKGMVTVKKKYTEGLADLEGFSHICLIYHLHKSKGFNLQVIPFLDNKPHGVFATRAPRRPNSIGISVVRLLKITDNTIEIENADILNGTPLLDIKPYLPEFDVYEAVNKGWAKDITDKVKQIRSDSRFK
jgi:tRNA-Thr(GGU) m(6)t(6)A37 methyltransferase TsaA